MEVFRPVSANGRIRDLAGKTFGRLEVVCCLGVGRDGKSIWECRCVCGNVKPLSGATLMRVKPGGMISCGCYLRRRSIEEKFWPKVKKTDRCWLWTGGKTGSGYGQMRHHGKVLEAHRQSWVIANGPIPSGMQVCHDCPGGDNPACVNPAHLFLGTQGDNNRDKMAKGMGTWGRGRSKLTEAKVRNLRRLAASGMTQVSLAQRYRLSVVQVRKIIHRRAWAWVK